jgi:hypothetical protein
MTASKSLPLKVIGFYSLSADWTAYARFLRQEIDSRDPAYLSEESREMLPLRSSYGELTLPSIQPLPDRLWRLAPYEIPS